MTIKDAKGIHDRIDRESFDFRSGWDATHELVTSVYLIGGFILGLLVAFVLDIAIV